MWRSIGTALPFLGAAAVFIAYFYFQHVEKMRKLEIVQRERLAALEKGLPLPEWPVLDVPSPPVSPPPPNPHSMPVTGIILMAIAGGAMLVLYATLPQPAHSFWVLPLPVALVGLGLLIYHYLPKARD